MKTSHGLPPRLSPPRPEKPQRATSVHWCHTRKAGERVGAKVGGTQLRAAVARTPQQSAVKCLGDCRRSAHSTPMAYLPRVPDVRVGSKPGHCGDVCYTTALPPTTAVMMQCRERQKDARRRHHPCARRDQGGSGRLIDHNDTRVLRAHVTRWRSRPPMRAGRPQGRGRPRSYIPQRPWEA